ncbi:sugar ABC transporter substrate-binding protein [Mesorhizobium sp. CGMCC 1.15528]|uniref:Sugar ABC transporter substrate-binding protein n=1 Tax=Mesorhizobium zhangyense TaxID=1776730 RepID=A0A7C9V6Y4_9HYPH|nr:sugar ABC transporter substrate-binding protein [Mesorhizobium zhangyense]NGN41884.1 sugar ABC transporter substrate-binding protein [Mesorhizobium zhangyense]
MIRMFSLGSILPVTAGLLLASTVTTVVPARAQVACERHAIDLGDGKSVMGGCEPLKIAFMIAATNNTHLQAQIKGAQDAAKEIGATLDVFDPNWSPTTQFNQAQNIISGGQYNAVLAEMNDGNQACGIMTDKARAAGVLVAVTNQPLCNRGTNEGDELWAPGTLNFVGGSQGRTAFRDWIMSIAEENPGPQQVAVVTGPDLNSNTINTDLALKDVQEKYPEFKVIAVVRTDYSVVQGNQKTLPLFQANPDLTIFISNYSDMTRGAVQAARQVGLLDKLKVYDSGGNDWAFKAVAAGQITSTRTIEPYTETYLAVKQLGDAWTGTPVARFTPTKSIKIDAETVKNNEPQY